MSDEDIQKQIDAMINAGHGTEVPGTEVPGTVAPGTRAPVTGAPATSAPSTKAPVTSAPSTSAPTTTAPATEVPEDPEVKRLREEIETLRQQVEESHKKKQETAAPTTAAPVEDIDFLGNDIDLDELTRDSKAFNALLNKVYKMGEEARRRSQEDTLKSIPNIVKSNVAIQATLKEKVTKFYEDNKDLAGFKKVCTAVSEELISENPNWSLDKVFSEVAKESRKRLGLQKKASATTAPATKPPGGPNFPRTKTSRQRPKPETSSLLTEIDEMNKVQ